MSAKILFLGYNNQETSLVNEIEGRGFNVVQTNERIEWSDEYRLAISYGYRHIISKKQISDSTAPIINLHISYLPWNKGAHPNFWSHFDCTPSGVTIHEIDEGVDTGNIIVQKYVNFEKSEITFSQTFKRLRKEVEILFIKNIDKLLSTSWESTPQRRSGTCHKLKDLPTLFGGWDTVIKDEIVRLDKLLKIN